MHFDIKITGLDLTLTIKTTFDGATGVLSILIYDSGYQSAGFVSGLSTSNMRLCDQCSAMIVQLQVLSWVSI
jgi:hypothetical protein